jgi:hypothetical protein
VPDNEDHSEADEVGDEEVNTRPKRTRRPSTRYRGPEGRSRGGGGQLRDVIYSSEKGEEQNGVEIGGGRLCRRRR